MKEKIITSILIGMLSMPAMALPILTESEDGSGLIATIYPDHENSRKFYFFPNSGEIEKNDSGIPRFGMAQWNPKDENSAAGYFSGIFHLKISHDLKEAVQNKKKEGKEIAVIPVQKSYIHFMKNNENEPIMSDFFKEVSIPPFAGRAEDSVGISATLTEEGAYAFASILTAGGNALDLRYCYEIKGLSPIFHANIQLNYNKVYTHFLAQSQGGRWWWKWNIRTEVEKLVENGTIKIQINGGDANKYDYIMSLTDRMVEKFMDPRLENRKGTTSGRFGVSYTRIVEDRDLSFDLKQRELITREYCVGLGLGELQNFPWLITSKK